MDIDIAPNFTTISNETGRGRGELHVRIMLLLLLELVVRRSADSAREMLASAVPESLHR